MIALWIRKWYNTNRQVEVSNTYRLLDRSVSKLGNLVKMPRK
jgi:hypothetical protein